MSWLSNLFGGGKNPADAANKYLNQIPGAVNPYYQPYINQGRTADQDLMERYNQLLNNPNDLYSQFASGYKESPGYQTRLQQGLQSATNAAASGGMAGSPQHQQQAAQTAVDLSSKDYEDYLNHILGLYGTGLQGEQGVGERGYNASTGYGNILGSNLAQQGGLAYQGQAAQNANQSNLFGNLFKLGSSFVPGLGNLNLLPNRPYG
jgi:hypothetical protein